MIYPIKCKLIKIKATSPEPEKWKDIDNEKYELHFVAMKEGYPINEPYFVDGFILDVVRTVYREGDTVNVDGLLCTDLDGNVSLIAPESVKVDVYCIDKLHRKQFN